MPLPSGTRLSRYGMTALIGEGGTEQARQAADTQLKHQVAQTILADAFAADPDRFAKEGA